MATYWSKMARFFIPHLYLAPSPGWPHRNFVKMFDADKTRIIVLPYGEKNWQFVKPFSSDTGTSRTDRRTDRATCISISRVGVLTRDKNKDWRKLTATALARPIRRPLLTDYILLQDVKHDAAIIKYGTNEILTKYCRFALKGGYYYNPQATENGLTSRSHSCVFWESYSIVSLEKLQ